jgi:peroxiredoxin Q/BCP
MPKAPNALKPGDKAPAFDLPDQHGDAVRLADFKGRPLVVYFYPKDDTEDCTTQACDFTRRFPAFEKVGAAVVGISRLDQKSKAKFAAKHKITVPLLADESTKVSDAFGVLVEKSMYGKKFMGIVRTTFLIDGAGKIAARWDVTDVAGHADEVLNAVKLLAEGKPVPVAAEVEAKPKPVPKKKAAAKKPPAKKKATRSAK